MRTVALTTTAPAAPTQSSTLGQGVDLPRSQCVTAAFNGTFPEDCGYPAILGATADGKATSNRTPGGKDDVSQNHTLHLPSRRRWAPLLLKGGGSVSTVKPPPGGVGAGLRGDAVLWPLDAVQTEGESAGPPPP